MTSLLDAINAQKHGQPVSSAGPAPLVIPEIEWRHFLETGACPWEEVRPGLYQHCVTGQVYEWGQPFVLPEMP